MEDEQGLTPLPPQGPKGVGSIMERLEREALAEAAAQEAAGASASTSTSGMPAYVPGAKKRRLSNNGDAAAGPSRPPTKPLSSSNNAGKANGRSLSSSVGVGQGTRDGSSSSAAAANATTSDAAAAANDGQPEAKKRKQPTIRVSFQYKAYSANKDKIEAKHVPIFQVQDLIVKAGLLLPPEEVIVDDASSSGGSDDEDDGEKADQSNDGADEVSIDGVKARKVGRVQQLSLSSPLYCRPPT